MRFGQARGFQSPVPGWFVGKEPLGAEVGEYWGSHLHSEPLYHCELAELSRPKYFHIKVGNRERALPHW